MEREERLQKQKEFLIQVAYWAFWGGLVLVVFKYVGPVILPFVLAFLVAWVLCAPIDYISNRLRMERKIVSVIVIALFYALLAGLLYLLGSRVVELIQGVFSNIASFLGDTFFPMLQKFSEGMKDGFIGEQQTERIGRAMQENTTGIVNYAGNMMSGLTETVVDGMSGVAAQIPQFFMNIMLAVIATVFFELEFKGIMRFLVRQIPERFVKTAEGVREYAVGTLGKCMISYVLILSITFAELAIGFWLLGIKGAITIAFFVALLDILPVLGTGTVLLPWMIIAFASGDLKIGVGILFLYLVITVVRNIIEPRLVGRQMGLPPVVMLPCMIVGLHFFGILGLFALPLVVAFLNRLNERGVIHIFRLEKDEQVRKN